MIVEINDREYAVLMAAFDAHLRAKGLNGALEITALAAKLQEVKENFAEKPEIKE